MSSRTSEDVQPPPRTLKLGGLLFFPRGRHPPRLLQPVQDRVDRAGRQAGPLSDLQTVVSTGGCVQHGLQHRRGLESDPRSCVMSASHTTQARRHIYIGQEPAGKLPVSPGCDHRPGLRWTGCAGPACPHWGRLPGPVCATAKPPRPVGAQVQPPLALPAGQPAVRDSAFYQEDLGGPDLDRVVELTRRFQGFPAVRPTLPSSRLPSGWRSVRSQASTAISARSGHTGSISLRCCRRHRHGRRLRKVADVGFV
jgi:hypothetical protein